MNLPTPRHNHTDTLFSYTTLCRSTPHVPTTHANVGHFRAVRDGQTVAWWFGGGFDLTPFYPADEDVLHWHRTARDLCAPFGDDRYPAHKRWCDEYFFLKHRNETRGVGGLFFDDLHTDFERDFDYLRAVGEIGRAHV